MTKAKISEIFLSYQGEGPYVGSRQLFVRFYGCNLKCVFCDTFMEGYKIFTERALLSKVLDFEDDYNEIVLTGGEPLLFGAFLDQFLPLFRSHRQNNVYLETNGTLPDELKRIIGHIDIIAMDIKLPSSTNNKGDLWKVHKKFACLAKSRELIVKSVVTDKTDIDDIKRMSNIVAGLGDKTTVVLQPVTPVNDYVKEPDGEMVLYFKKYMEKETEKDIMVLGQAHQCLGVK